MKNILIVDDEKSIRLTLAEFLKKEGYIAETAEDVETALDLISKRSFDVIISDILMPKKSGIDLLKSILSTSPNSKVIMITGEPNVQTAAQAIRLGACDYLNKPVDKNSVIKAVNNAIEIKNLEDKNRDYQNNLESLVKKRTRELEDALEKQEKMQQQIIHQERLQGLCLISSGIAHNINNTISPIFMYSEALLEKNSYLDEDSRGYIEKIISAAEDIESIVVKMEDVYNVQTGICSRKDSVDTSRMISDVSEYFKNTLKQDKREISIEVEVSEKLPNAFFEEKSLEDILKAVLTNSIEAIDEDGRISIKTHKSENSIVLIIEDNGSGMNHEQLEHCFDPFYTSKGPKYSGLGLTFVYGSVNRNNGRIDMNSDYGVGTVTTLYLPICNEIINKTSKETTNA